MNRTISVTIGLVLALVLGSRAEGQTIDGSAYFAPLTDNVQPLIYGNMFSKSYLDKKKKAGTSPRRADAKPDSPQDRSADSYVSVSSDDLLVDFNARVSDDVRSEYIDSISGVNGDQAARSLDTYYQRNNVRALFDTAISPYGLRGDDLADVMTAYVVVMWMTANQSGLPATGDVQGVRRQMRDILLSEGRIPSSSNARQRAAESLMYQTVTLIKVREEAQSQRNEQYLSYLADTAQASMQRQKFDLRGLAMTSEGLVQR